MPETIVGPARKFRILYTASSGKFCHVTFPTIEKRNAAADRAAAKHNTAVIAELWDASHPQDEINQGWACDYYANPPHIQKQHDNLREMTRVVGAAVPGALAVILQTSDQDTYGFTLRDVEMLDGTPLAHTNLPLHDELDEKLFPLICDLDWNAAVGEDKTGYARVVIPPVHRTAVAA